MKITDSYKEYLNRTMGLVIFYKEFMGGKIIAKVTYDTNNRVVRNGYVFGEDFKEIAGQDFFINKAVWWFDNEMDKRINEELSIDLEKTAEIVLSRAG